MVNSIPELELTLNSSSGIGIDFKKKKLLEFFIFKIYFLGIGIDFVGIIDLILLIYLPLYLLILLLKSYLSAISMSP